MPDREKVLQGLDCCIRKMEGERVCDECPYDEDFNCLGCSVVLRQAIALLREQEPVKPYDNPLGYCRCGNCGTHVHRYEEQDKYCPHCGRAVKWDE